MSTSVKKIMIPKVKTVDETDRVIDVVQLMSKYNIGAVVVLSAIGDAVGIFTERDLMRRVVAEKMDMEIPIKKVMTPDFQCVQLDDDIDGLAQIMLNGNFRHLPVVEGRHVIGMISIRDLLRLSIQDS